MKKSLLAVFAAGLCAAIILPVFASEKVDASKEISSALKEMSKLETQSVCPISGNAVAEGAGVSYMGYFIGTCCPNCAKAVEKEPLSAIKALRAKGQQPKLVEGVKVQDSCPIMGKKIDEDVWAVKDNMLVKFCCAGCVSQFTDKPVETAKAMVEKGQAPVILTLEQKACPVSGGAISKESSVDVEGKKIYLCCDGCAGKVKAEPAKYLQAMADKGVVLENAS